MASPPILSGIRDVVHMLSILCFSCPYLAVDLIKQSEFWSGHHRFVELLGSILFRLAFKRHSEGTAMHVPDLLAPGFVCVFVVETNVGLRDLKFYVRLISSTTGNHRSETRIPLIYLCLCETCLFYFISVTTYVFYWNLLAPVYSIQTVWQNPVGLKWTVVWRSSPLEIDATSCSCTNVPHKFASFILVSIFQLDLLNLASRIQQLGFTVPNPFSICLVVEQNVPHLGHSWDGACMFLRSFVTHGETVCAHQNSVLN